MHTLWAVKKEQLRRNAFLTPCVVRAPVACWERSVPIVHVTKVSEMLSLIHWANSEVQSPAPMDPPYILFLFFKPSWHAFRTVTLSQAALTTSL